MAVGLIILLCPGKGLAAVPAFPSAEGFGKWTIGGRAGTVIEVTNLNDSGAGSLRAAVEASGPRTVVFRTGGVITLQSNLLITDPYLTIAGQTAPGGGITIRNDTSNTKGLVRILHTHDVIIRHLRVRVGAPTVETGVLDGLAIEGKDALNGLEVGPTDTYNIILDHCSVSWAVDENMPMTGAKDVTVQWCIVSEGLYNSVHPAGVHSRGILVRQNSQHVTVHHNLMAHHEYRNPQLGHEADYLEAINNVTYNWKKFGLNGNSTKAGFYARFSIVSNYFKKGHDSWVTHHEICMDPASDAVGIFSIYVHNNIGPFRTDDSQPDSNSVDADDVQWMVGTPPFTPSGVVSASAPQAYGDVLAHAGCRVPMLDSVDQRIIDDVINGTGQLIDNPSEVGGWPVLDPGTPPTDTDHDGMPDSWESAHGLNPNNASDGADYSGNGYTNLENYLNELAGDTVPQTPGVTSWMLY